MIRKRAALLLGIALLVSGLGYCFGFRTTQANSHGFAIKNIFERENLVPLLIVGSGPAGLMAGVYGARAGKKTIIVEGYKPGGLLMDTSEVENWPGEAMITGPAIIEKLKEQARYQGVDFIPFDAVEKVDTSSWPYRVQLESGTVLHALSIIIATGASPRRLGVPGEDTYWGNGVTSCAKCDASFYKGEEVVVVGGGDSAIEEAIQLSPYAQKITILVRKDRMRASDSMQKRLQNYPKISVKYNVAVQKIIGGLEQVTAVELYNAKEQSTEEFPTAGVFLAIGHIPNSLFIRNQVKTDSDGYILINYPHHETSVRGIFAAGDIADKIYRQAGTSAGDGIEAALDASEFLDGIGYSNQVAAQVAHQIYRPQVLRTPEKELLSFATMAELKELMNQNPDKLIIADFWTEGCQPCKNLAPAIQEASHTYADSIVFVSIDAGDADDELLDTVQVSFVPTLVAFYQGTIIERIGDQRDEPLTPKELNLFFEKCLSEARSRS